jgi:hypothetical protein
VNARRAAPIVAAGAGSVITASVLTVAAHANRDNPSPAIAALILGLAGVQVAIGLRCDNGCVL